jgi:hypothetical protein
MFINQSDNVFQLLGDCFSRHCEDDSRGRSNPQPPTVFCNRYITSGEEGICQIPLEYEKDHQVFSDTIVHFQKAINYINKEFQRTYLVI